MAAQQSLVVAYRSFSATIGFSGTIVGGDPIDITAPFDGKVKRLGFRYGDLVSPGQMLVELDTADLRMSRNEAESALLKAEQNAEELDSWGSSKDVLRARRSLSSATDALGDTDRKIAETQSLFDRGLVPRTELDGLQQQRRSQQAAILSARDEVDAVEARGRGGNRRMALLELANARTRYAKLNQQLEAAIIEAPGVGIVIEPVSDVPGAGSNMVRVGMRLAEGAAIGSIVRAGGLGVTFRVDEADVNGLKPGLEVGVTGPGFAGLALTGRIKNIARQAQNGAGAAPGKASFTAYVGLDPLPAQMEQIRIGMTANVSIVTYTNPRAIVVPQEAVQGAAPDTVVMVRDRDGAVHPVTVQLGRIAPDGVEILSGLRPGMTVIWGKPPAGDPGAGS